MCARAQDHQPLPPRTVPKAGRGAQLACLGAVRRRKSLSRRSPCVADGAAESTHDQPSAASQLCAARAPAAATATATGGARPDFAQVWGFPARTPGAARQGRRQSSQLPLPRCRDPPLMPRLLLRARMLREAGRFRLPRHPGPARPVESRDSKHREGGLRLRQPYHSVSAAVPCRNREPSIPSPSPLTSAGPQEPRGSARQCATTQTGPRACAMHSLACRSATTPRQVRAYRSRRSAPVRRENWQRWQPERAVPGHLWSAAQRRVVLVPLSIQTVRSARDGHVAPDRS